MEPVRISVIINNYNYGQFLGQAIDSVLSQTVKAFELIVVDDGSTDHSLSVAQVYGDQIKLIRKENGGQASAFNDGFNASKGDWIWFLDADDWLMPDALENVSQLIRPGISKIHGRLLIADEQGVAGKKMIPEKLSSGNVLHELYEKGLYQWPPTSGNVFARPALEACMPIPKDKFRICADLYIANHAAFHGEIAAAETPLGYYRIHGRNHFSGKGLRPEQLHNRVINLAATVDLLKQLFTKDGKSYTFPYSRWNYELLLLAKRFDNTVDRQYPNNDTLYTCWKNTPEIKSLGIMKKPAYEIYWKMLEILPRNILERLFPSGR